MSKSRPCREAILARRALYLSAALATAGCPSRESSGPETAATDAPERSVKDKRRKKRKKKAAVPANTPWKEVMAKAPPLDVPEGLPKREASYLESLRTRMKGEYEAIEKVWTKTPGCEPTADACGDWKALAELAKKMYRATDRFSLGGCGGVYGKTGSVAARERAHRSYVGALKTQLEAHLEKVALHFGPEAPKTWGEMLKKAKEPPPRPCLSPCRMPEAEDIEVSVPFAENDAAIHEEKAPVASALKSAVTQHLQQADKAVIVVRGHADPREKDGMGLAKKRAEAVVAWLTKNGVDEADITTVALGAKLLVEKKGGTSGGAANRRVDFEVVMR
jgi:outer membrane protein OmpA-like peptidoglycan-associated protein